MPRVPYRLRLIPVALVAAGILAGCAPQLDRIELSVQENRDEMATLRAENRRLAQEVKALAELLRLEFASGDESNAQRVARLGQVSLRLEQLMQKLDDNSAYMRELSARVDLLATRSGVPTLGEYKPPAPDDGAGMAALPEEGRSIYQAAQLDRSRGNVDMARVGFRDFLDRFPTSELADDARYWLGDLAYGEQDWMTPAISSGACSTIIPSRPGRRPPCSSAATACRNWSATELADMVLRELVDPFPRLQRGRLPRGPGRRPRRTRARRSRGRARFRSPARLPFGTFAPIRVHRNAKDGNACRCRC